MVTSRHTLAGELGRNRLLRVHQNLTSSPGELINAILKPLEDEWLQGDHSGDDDINARAKRLRTAILPDMVKGDIEEA